MYTNAEIDTCKPETFHRFFQQARLDFWQQMLFHQTVKVFEQICCCFDSNRLCSLHLDPFYSFCGRPKQNNPFYYTQTIKQQKRCKTTGWTMISNDRVLYIMYILKNHHVYCHSVLLTWELKGHNHFRQGSTPTRVPRIVPPFKSSCIYMLRKHL